MFFLTLQKCTLSWNMPYLNQTVRLIESFWELVFQKEEFLFLITALGCLKSAIPIQHGSVISESNNFSDKRAQIYESGRWITAAALSVVSVFDESGRSQAKSTYRAIFPNVRWVPNRTKHTRVRIYVPFSRRILFIPVCRVFQRLLIVGSGAVHWIGMLLLLKTIDPEWIFGRFNLSLIFGIGCRILGRDFIIIFMWNGYTFNS